MHSHTSKWSFELRRKRGGKVVQVLSVTTLIIQYVIYFMPKCCPLLKVETVYPHPVKFSYCRVKIEGKRDYYYDFV
jgi:hypothetical protein